MGPEIEKHELGEQTANESRVCVDPVVMTHIQLIKKVLDEVGLPYTVRKEGDYEYFFIGAGDDASCIYGLHDNFDTTALNLLQLRHKYWEFEKGELCGWHAS